jgi:hypothetical protein
MFEFYDLRDGKWYLKEGFEKKRAVRMGWTNVLVIAVLNGLEHILGR